MDRICRDYNRRLDRRFGAALDAAYAANDYERLADLFQQSERLSRPFYRAVRELGQDVPEQDAPAYARYVSLSQQLDNYFNRLIRAFRQADDAELARLGALIQQARNQRTRVTARMGLRECGS